MTTTLTCPKCMSEMRSYERNGILVDQCTGCGGLFLDRGELEKLTAAENEWHTEAPPAVTAPSPQDRSYAAPQPTHRDDRGYREERGRHDDRGYQGGGHEQQHRRKKKSFLSELFDD
ncbi:zf-TFIIB domain-containing protein [Lapillicoccus sp.]|uniref:TFIIB-type zinc ribbon-containing protein n=1 Tax=Lapillicoccus sp. TaxID=1909287 RepID=UPI0039836713